MVTAPPTILICALDPLNEALHDTLIWRDGLERHVATTYRDALVLANSASPDLIVVDRDMPQAERLVEDLRLSRTTKEASIVVVASGPMNDAELGLLTAGANAVLRLPAGRAWEQKLGRLIEVPSRHQVEIPVRIGLKSAGQAGGSEGTILNLSESGGLIKCAAGLRVGDAVDLGFRLPRAKQVMAVQGGVARATGDHLFGIQFLGLRGDQTERLRLFLEIQHAMSG